jgi:hypothetical protein
MSNRSSKQAPKFNPLTWGTGRASGCFELQNPASIQVFSRVEILWLRDALSARHLGDDFRASTFVARRGIFTRREVTEVSERLMRFSLTRMRPILMGHTLDVDSTILCR